MLFLMMLACLFLIFPDLEKELGKNLAIAASAIVGVSAWFFYKLFVAPPEIKSDQVYYKRAADASSDANYFAQSAGRFWSPAAMVLSKMVKPDGLVIDRFVFKKEVKNRLFMPSLFCKKFTEKDLSLTPLDMTKGVLSIGAMGSGKTVMAESMLLQNRDYKLFNRVLIHDKKGDFRQKFYNKKRDLILNPFDKEGAVWDFWGENDVAQIEVFFAAYMRAIQGETRNFFAGSAKKRYMDLVKEIFYQNETSLKKWEMFLDALDVYFEEVSKMPKSSEHDIAKTLELQIEFFKLQYYILKNGAKSFTFKKYFASSKCTIFMLNTPIYLGTLEPYFTGFIAIFAAVLASQKDTKSDFTFLLLDEYISFLKVMDDLTIDTIHTLIRSKGGIGFYLIQYLPEHSGEKNLVQALLNSSEWVFVFESNDVFTIKKLQESVGKVKYTKVSRSSSTFQGSAGFSAKGNESRSTERVDLLGDEAFSNLEFSHITYSRAQNILYRGFTKMVKLVEKNEPFIQRDLSHFYLFQNKKNTK